MKNKYYAKKLEILLLSLCFLCGGARSGACSAARSDVADDGLVAVQPEHMRAVYSQDSSGRDSARKMHIVHDTAIENDCAAVEPGRVRVVYFSKKGERYSTTYDVSDSQIYVDLGRRKAIVPLQYALQLEYLKCYILKPGCTAPDITDVDFSDKDMALRFTQNMTTVASADQYVELRDYSRKWFFSELIENFLVKYCQDLAKEGKTYSDDSAAALTTDMPKTVRQTYSFKKFSWGVVSDGRALKIEQEGQDKPQILIFIGGVGVLWGKLITTLFGDTSPHQRSLHCYKIKGAAKKICTKYPFSKEAWRKCIN